MKDTLKPGLSHTLTFKVPKNKTVPFLYPEAPGFVEMPSVFATGYMVGLFEWACIELMKPHLEPGEGSLGIHVDFSHTAATPPGPHHHCHRDLHQGGGPHAGVRGQRP